ncbi:MAG: DsbA family protein [Nitrospina sp.]|jgi:protein-disulfide isomerase|nr:DsbA family protein [Nitrospina sp.]
MNKIVLWILIICFVPFTTFAEGITKEQGDAILKELKSIRKELNEIKQKGLVQQGRGRPARSSTATVSTAGEPILGNLKAPVTLVEFTDYQCPFCRKFYKNAYKELKKQYVETGKVRFVLRDLALPNHQRAKPAAISTHCAGEQDKFWEMHDALFEGGGKLSRDDILGYGKSIGMNEASFKSCLDSGRYKKDIELDAQDARNVGINGTPGFVVGRTNKNSLVTGTIIRGTRPFSAFKAEIDKLLSQK